MKYKNKKVIIVVVIGIVVLGIIEMFLPSKQNVNIDDKKTGNIEETQEVFHQDKDINRFILDYNKTNPNNAFTKEEVSKTWDYETIIYNHSIKSIELSYHTNDIDKENYISIQLENYGDTTNLKQVYKEMMKTIDKNITDDKLNELWNNITTKYYEVDYRENKNAFKYNDIYLSFSDSGNVEVYGQKHFCFVRIYGKY